LQGISRGSAMRQVLRLEPPAPWNPAGSRCGA